MTFRLWVAFGSKPAWNKAQHVPRSCSAPAAPLAVSYPAHGSDEEVLLREADAAPYQAKAAGRNCVRYRG